MTKQPIITVTDLVKNYGDFAAVKGISFEVYEGEIFGLLGPNGAGKTTTLEIIETLRQKTSGRIVVDGFDIETDADSIKKRIGVQLQAAGYYPNLNLSELIVLFSGLYGIDKSPMEMLEKADLVLTMSESHRQIILDAVPNMSKQVFTLKQYVKDGKDTGGNMDIADPYMGDEAVYKRCSIEIKNAVDKLVIKLKGIL